VLAKQPNPEPLALLIDDIPIFRIILGEVVRESTDEPAVVLDMQRCTPRTQQAIGRANAPTEAAVPTLVSSVPQEGSVVEWWSEEHVAAVEATRARHTAAHQDMLVALRRPVLDQDELDAIHARLDEAFEDLKHLTPGWTLQPDEDPTYRGAGGSYQRVITA
jgi:hypothetical protein